MTDHVDFGAAHSESWKVFGPMPATSSASDESGLAIDVEDIASVRSRCWC